MTFSIVGFDAATGELGVAVSTALPCVGAVCPYVRPGVGAISTQAWVEPRLGGDGLDLLGLGLSPRVALEALLTEDPRAERRQWGGVDARGRAWAYTGEACTPWAGHRTGEGYAVQGNLLVGPETVAAMETAYTEGKGDLAERLLQALEAGQAAGGDRRGRISAALLVPAAPGRDRTSWTDLRVDRHDDPVAELRRLLDAVRSRRGGMPERR